VPATLRGDASPAIRFAVSPDDDMMDAHPSAGGPEPLDAQGQGVEPGKAELS
jgi:hypothetical protein